MLETFNCPSCNASLDPPSPPAPTVTCPYCGTTVLVPESIAGEDVEFDAVMEEIRSLLRSGRKIEAIKRYREQFNTSLQAAKTAVELMAAREVDHTHEDRGSGGSGCRVTLAVLVLLIVGAVGAAFLFIPTRMETSLDRALSAVDAERTLGNQLIGEGALYIAGEDGATADVAFVLRDHVDEQMTVAYLDGETVEQRWPEARFPLVSTAPTMAASDSLVFVVLETQLRAYDRETGEQRWEAALTDQPYSTCESCLLPFGDVLVARTRDGQLQAYDAQDGSPLWRERLEGSGAGELFRLGGQLAFMDDDETAGVGLELVDPATGELTKRLEPRCPHPFFDPQEPDTDSTMAVDQATNSVTFFFGFFDPACVQQWEYQSGEERWNLFVEDYSLSGDSAVLSGRSRFYLASMGHQLFSVAKDGSDFRLLLEDEDYDLQPLAENGPDILLLRATRSRGTRRDELWAMDSSSGEVLWRHIPQAEEMLAANEAAVVWQSGDGLWHAQADPRGVFVMQARPGPPRLVFETLDALTGASSGQIELAVPVFSESSYRIELLGWDREAVWLLADLRQLWAIDPATSAVVKAWP